MKSTLKSRPAAHTQAAAARSGVHLEPSHGVQPKPIAQRGGFAAGIVSAPRVTLQRKQLHAAFGRAIQRQAGLEEEELLQGKFSTLQRQGLEEEELLQGKFDPVQRQAGPEEEELLQGKVEPLQRQEGLKKAEAFQMKAMPATLQRQSEMEEEELIQGKLSPVQRQDEEELLQGKMESVQRQGELEEEELIQGKFETTQRQGLDDEELVQGKLATSEMSMQLKGHPGQQENRTGMPDNLKAGIENLSGMSMDGVKVHYNSSKPAQLNALAYTQGQDIEVGSGQERHLAHEGWHAVQQMQGRVKPTIQTQGVTISDNEDLEHEASVMGTKALQMRRSDQVATDPSAQSTTPEQSKAEQLEASAVPGEAIGVSGEKVRSNLLTTNRAVAGIVRSKTIQRYDLRAFDSWDEHVAWIIRHAQLPENIAFRIAPLGDYVENPSTDAKAMYLPPAQEGLTGAGKLLRDSKASGAVLVADWYVRDLEDLPVTERAFTLISTLRHEYQHAENKSTGLMPADATDAEADLDEVISHSENILNQQLGAVSDAPFWDQVDHLLQAEAYLSSATERGKQGERTTANLLAEAQNALAKAREKLRADLLAEGIAEPEQLIKNYLDRSDFHLESNTLATKSEVMEQLLSAV